MNKEITGCNDCPFKHSKEGQERDNSSFYYSECGLTGRVTYPTKKKPYLESCPLIAGDILISLKKKP